MKRNDEIFGELDYNYNWFGIINIEYEGKEIKISLLIDGNKDEEFSESQYEAYKSFMKNWKQIQNSLLPAILDYYKKERCELGYDVEENDRYPFVETTEKILTMISITGIKVPYSGILAGRDIGITFDCTWDAENGLGIRLLNERIFKIGYQNVAL